MGVTVTPASASIVDKSTVMVLVVHAKFYVDPRALIRPTHMSTFFLSSTHGTFIDSISRKNDYKHNQSTLQIKLQITLNQSQG